MRESKTYNNKIIILATMLSPVLKTFIKTKLVVNVWKNNTYLIGLKPGT